jgi:putative heme-binding domain-containing protein
MGHIFARRIGGLGACLAAAALVTAALLIVPAVVRADGAGPLLTLLQSGKVPPERQPTVVEMVCKKGNADDLAYVFGQVIEPEAYSPELRLKTLTWLTDAAKINKVKPAGDLAQIKRLLADRESVRNPAFALAAMRLAAEWQVASIGDELRRLATAEPDPAASSADKQAADKLQAAAIEGLATIGDAPSRLALEKLAAAGHATRTRFRAVAALAAIDLDAAAKAAAPALAQATPRDEPAAMIQAFLDRKGGPDHLADALAQAQLPLDVAKLALRTMYSAGRSDASLSGVLSKAAGMAADVPPPTGAEVGRIVAEVVAKGDAARGERVFRRTDVNCMKCHSISGGGGNIGPDLSPIGTTSPVEYVVNSILNPNLAIKESYITKNIVTTSGQTLSGVVIDRNDQEVKLRDATGAILVVATADIDEEVEGRSPMPEGLVKFLTHDELLDLAKFVSELGKPGPYALRTRPTVQRWRVLKSPSDQLKSETPNVEILRQEVLAAPAESWLPAFGMVAGMLPLDEVKAATGESVLYLQGTIEVQEAGPVALAIHSTEPVQAWLDVTSFDPAQPLITDLAAGTHTLTLRVTVGDTTSPQLRAEFSKPAGSAAQFTVQ